MGDIIKKHLKNKGIQEMELINLHNESYLKDNIFHFQIFNLKKTLASVSHFINHTNLTRVWSLLKHHVKGRCGSN